MRGVHAAVAGIYRQEGRPDWAAVEEAREKALPPPDCARVPLECAFAAGRYREIADAPDGTAAPESLYWRARAHGELAREAFVRLAELPPSAVSHRLAAEIRRLEGRHAESAAEWRKALEFEPAGDNLRIELARSLMAAENSREALPVLEEVLGRRPKHAEASLLAGRCLLSLQEPDRAVPHLEAAVAAMPRDLDARAALGQAYLQSGDPKRALPELEAAAAADEDGNLNYLLAQAYARLGNQEAARRALAAREERRKAGRVREEERERTYRLTAPPAPRP
jgi:predicted Zn-dependent protease